MSTTEGFSTDLATAFIVSLPHNGGSTELRAFHEVRKGPAQQHFLRRSEQGIDAEQMAKAMQWAEAMSRSGSAIYYGINPRARDATSGKREDCLRWRFLGLDIDAVRKGGMMATDEQKAITRTVAAEIVAWLGEVGIAGITAIDSGNGIQLLLPVDLPMTDESDDLAAHLEEIVRERFSRPEIRIDHTHDCPRIFRLPGSLNRKGKPHRMAKIIHLPTSEGQP
jgi:hypothetical protein